MDRFIKIFSNPEDLTEGIYGTCLTWLLELLYEFEQGNTHNINDSDTKVIFDINTLNNKNLIPKFIQPKKSYDIEESAECILVSLRRYKKRNKRNPCFKLNEESFKLANKVFEKYFTFNEFILDELNSLNIDNRALGVHFRGSDKNYDNSKEANSISKSEMLLIVQDYVERNEVPQIFCCSDEQEFVTRLKGLYPYRVIEYKQKRLSSSSEQALHFSGQFSNDADMDALTYSNIIDMLALARCNTVLKTSSAFSSFSKILNPALKLYTVSSMKLPYFPAAVAERYQSSSKIIKKILDRTMQGDCYNKL